MSDGTNVAQIAKLDLNASLFLGETFEHEGLGGAIWTLVPSDSKAFQKAATRLLSKSPAGVALMRRAVGSGIFGEALEAADEGFEKMLDMVLGKNGNRETLNKDAALEKLLTQWASQRDDARAEARKALEDVDLSQVIEAQDKGSARAVADHLVVKVENFPILKDGEEHRVGGDGEFAFGLFMHPQVGQEIFANVMDACNARAGDAKKALGESAGNS